MALYFILNSDQSLIDDDDEHPSLEWHIGENVPFFPLVKLREIQADGHEREFLVEKIHVIHALFGGKEKIAERVINTVTRDSALVVYGMMLADQAKKKFG